MYPQSMHCYMHVATLPTAYTSRTVLEVKEILEFFVTAVMALWYSFGVGVKTRMSFI